jgi:hypothetical protein
MVIISLRKAFSAESKIARIDGEFAVKLYGSRKTVLLLVFSLIVILLSFLAIFMLIDSDIVPDIDSDIVRVHVKDEFDLRNAIDNASFFTSTTIVLDNDVTLERSIRISEDKNITLTSNGNADFFKLTCISTIPYGVCPLYVDDGGVLILDGIIVTHENVYGGGVGVASGGSLILVDGGIIGIAV